MLYSSMDFPGDYISKPGNISNAFLIGVREQLEIPDTKEGLHKAISKIAATLYTQLSASSFIVFADVLRNGGLTQAAVLHPLLLSYHTGHLFGSNHLVSFRELIGDLFVGNDQLTLDLDNQVKRWLSIFDGIDSFYSFTEAELLEIVNALPQEIRETVRLQLNSNSPRSKIPVATTGTNHRTVFYNPFPPSKNQRPGRTLLRSPAPPHTDFGSDVQNSDVLKIQNRALAQIEYVYVLTSDNKLDSEFNGPFTLDRLDKVKGPALTAIKLNAFMNTHEVVTITNSAVSIKEVKVGNKRYYCARLNLDDGKIVLFVSERNHGHNSPSMPNWSEKQLRNILKKES